MNAPDSSRADDRYKWIAGYVDGELDEAARRRAEAWLANDPTAADALRDQEQFSPANRELWDAVASPEPSPAAWAGVTDRVAAAALPANRPGRPTIRWAVRVSALTAAAVVGWVTAGGPNPPAPPTEVPPVANPAADDPLAGFAVLPIADPADVEIVAVRGEHPDRFLVGDNPFPGGLTLAAPGDVTVAPGDDADTDPPPGAAPMIFPRPPR